MLWGSLYKPDTTDFEGRPLVFKSGPDINKPRVAFNFGVAIPKDGSGQHWSATPWGAEIWKAGHAGVSNANTLPDFSWKVTDGDSAVVPKPQPNKTPPKAPKDRTGYPGHWVLSLSSSFASGIYDGTTAALRQIVEADAVMPGDWIQVSGDASYNQSQGNPGVFLNHSMVAFSGRHVEGRLSGASQDPTTAGFQIGLAPGAVAAPVGALAAGATPPPAAPAASTPPPPAVAAPAPAASTPPPPAAAVAVAPNPAFAPPPPAAAVAAPPAPVRNMLPAAEGVTYEDYIKAGWTDALLIQHGKMAA